MLNYGRRAVPHIFCANIWCTFEAYKVISRIEIPATVSTLILWLDAIHFTRESICNKMSENSARFANGNFPVSFEEPASTRTCCLLPAIYFLHWINDSSAHTHTHVFTSYMNAYALDRNEIRNDVCLFAACRWTKLHSSEALETIMFPCNCVCCLWK